MVVAGVLVVFFLIAMVLYSTRLLEKERDRQTGGPVGLESLQDNGLYMVISYHDRYGLILLQSIPFNTPHLVRARGLKFEGKPGNRYVVKKFPEGWKLVFLCE